MNRSLLLSGGALALLFAFTSSAQVISSMDELRWTAPKEKAHAELIDGKTGKAVKFSFDKESRSAFVTSNIKGNTDWDKAAGFSFWVRGFGSNAWGGLQFIYNEDYGLRYDYMFPSAARTGLRWWWLGPIWCRCCRNECSSVECEWRNRPSKLRGPWFGRWWYWGDYPAQTFAVDEDSTGTSG